MVPASDTSQQPAKVRSPEEVAVGPVPQKDAQGTVTIHPTAEVSPQAHIGSGTRIWHQAQVREGARIGRGCILSKGVYVDFGVTIGDHCKLQNGVYVFHGSTLEDGVFLGPAVVLTNDKMPRAITPTGALKSATDWDVGPILIKYGASVGAGAIVLPNVTIGRWAMIGAGALVTRDVPDHGLAIGSPARVIGYVCRCGQRLEDDLQAADPAAKFTCRTCYWQGQPAQKGGNA